MRLQDSLGTISNVLMAVAAVLGIRPLANFGSAPRRSPKRSPRAMARSRRLGFDNPPLSDPTRKLADFDYNNLTVNGSKETFQKYELYVDMLLNASEGIMEALPNRSGEATIRIELNQHRDFLLSQHFIRTSGFTEEYTPEFQEFVREALDESAR